MCVVCVCVCVCVNSCSILKLPLLPPTKRPSAKILSLCRYGRQEKQNYGGGGALQEEVLKARATEHQPEALLVVVARAARRASRDGLCRAAPRVRVQAHTFLFCVFGFTFDFGGQLYSGLDISLKTPSPNKVDHQTQKSNQKF